MDDRMVSDDLDTILAEQRTDLMAAKTLDSDLDFAFKLQMQEAMIASLALKPSSSSISGSRNSPPPSPPHDAVLDLAAKLLLEDIERFAQERDDHERTVMEMMKAKEDLNRRIHDKKFTLDLHNMPEDYWAKHGDDYRRPYGNDGSSSSSSPSPSPKAAAAEVTENLRLYCKGLVSEEMVRDMKVVVAGAGVAICDPRDNLIFEARKNLEVVVHGVVLSNEAAELEAIIEGLNKALTLDLKSVTFYCDNYMLYQYVLNRVHPGNSKVAALVNQVAFLQRKFEYCRVSFMTRSDINFALKVAREAIVSQITWGAETSNGKSLKETCVICYEATDAAKMFSIDGCLHRYCFLCMKQHVEVKFLDGMMAECPHEGCKTEVNIDSCAKFLSPKLVEAMSQRIKESSIPATEKVYCPIPRCSALSSKKELLEYTTTVLRGAKESGARKCMKCHYFFCINCKVPWHYGMSCSDYKISHPHPCPEDQLLKSLAAQERWRQCIKCNHMVELAEGCYHITCRCGYEFCYTCGAEWKKKKKATCSCPIWDERNVIREQPPPQGQPNNHQQPGHGQPIHHQHARQAQPNFQQGRQAQPNLQQARQAQPNLQPNLRQARQTQPNLQPNLRQVQPNLRQVQPNLRQARQAQPNLQPNLRQAPQAQPNLQPNLRQARQAQPNLQPNLRQAPTLGRHDKHSPTFNPTLGRHDKHSPTFNPTLGRFNPTLGRHDKHIPTFNPTLGRFNPTLRKQDKHNPTFNPTLGRHDKHSPTFNPTLGRFSPTLGRFNPTLGRFNPTLGRHDKHSPTFNPTLGRFNPTLGRQDKHSPTFNPTLGRHDKHSPTFSRHNKHIPTFSTHDKRSPTFSRHDKHSPTFSRHDKHSLTFSRHDKHNPTFSRHNKHSLTFSRHDKHIPTFSRHDEYSHYA